MRCPNCGADTSSASSWCLRCNAPLPPSGSAPPPPPWETAPEERAAPLSPEPWAADPTIWQPPPPPKKSRLPHFLLAAGGGLLLGVAAVIVLWPSGPGQSAQPPAGPAQSRPPGQTQSRAAPSGGAQAEDAAAQARAVDELLGEMSATRSSLGAAVQEGCTADELQRILEERTGQLEKARALDVSALDNGDPMKDALVRALEASAESNRRYREVAPGCPPESAVADVNGRASAAKREFLAHWGPIAEQAGLPSRTESDI